MNIVKVYVAQVDNFSFAQCNPVLKDVNCEGATVIGMAWLEPIYNRGVRQEWLRSLETVKPTLDSIRVIMIQTKFPAVHTYYMAVGDADTPVAFTDLCNACCGSTPIQSLYTPPIPIVEDCACKDTNGNYVFSYPLPNNPNGLLLKITGYSFNGAYGTPAPPASFADGAAMLIWLLANWAAYGTWTLVSGVLRLTGTTTSCMGLQLDTVDASYCMPYPSAGTLTADALVFQTSATGPTYATTPFPGGPVTYSNTSTGPLIYVLQQLLAGTLAVNAGTPNRLQYTGKQIPVKLQVGGVDVVGGAFTAGVCLNTFTFPIPANPSSFNYFITGGVFNGIAGTPVALVSGWATTGAMLTWLNTNWSAYGAWTIVGSNLLLNAHSTTTATLTISVHA